MAVNPPLVSCRPPADQYQHGCDGHGSHVSAWLYALPDSARTRTRARARARTHTCIHVYTPPPPPPASHPPLPRRGPPHPLLQSHNTHTPPLPPKSNPTPAPCAAPASYVKYLQMGDVFGALGPPQSRSFKGTGEFVLQVDYVPLCCGAEVCKLKAAQH